MRALLCLAVLAATAAADPLTSSVAKMTPDPAVLVVAKRAGKTPIERYRAGPGLVAANTPLVATARRSRSRSTTGATTAGSTRTSRGCRSSRSTSAL